MGLETGQKEGADARRLRIAVLNRTFAPTGGGAERYAMALVEQLAARHEVHVFAQEIAHSHPGVTYHRVSMPLRRPRWVNQLWYATATWWATRQGSGQGFDVVHSHENTWHGNVQTVHVLPVWHNLFQGRTGVKRALRWLKVLTSPRLLTYLALESLRFRVKAGGNQARCVMVTSGSLRQVMAATFPDSRDALSVLVPGVDVPVTTTAVQHREARAQLGLPQAVPCLLLVGNDFRKKGLGALLEALNKLSKKEQNASVRAPVLAVVGSLQQQAEFLPRVEALGLRQRVFFLGPMDDVTVAYRAADILVHPTQEDTFAMVVLEAMAHSLPVVVSDARYCGIAGLLQDGVHALLLDDPHDAAQLAGLLQQLLDNPALQQSLGVAALALARRHAWAEKALQQEAIYQALAAEAVAEVGA